MFVLFELTVVKFKYNVYFGYIHTSTFSSVDARRKRSRETSFDHM